MQKKVIALAVAGLASGAAFAQSNVTIYGVVDAGYVYSSGDRFNANAGTADFAGINTGLLAGSRIGFKGEEGLGNGLKALFTLEYGIGVDANGGIGTIGGSTTHGQNTRQSFVGLNHNKLGTVALGRQYAPGFAAAARTDAFFGSVPSVITTFTGNAGNSISAGSNARISNSVTYASPVWSGFSVSGIYGFGENAQNPVVASNDAGTSTGNNGIFGAGLNYSNGPLSLDAVYQTRQGRTGTIVAGAQAGVLQTALAGTKDDTNEYLLGGSYDFKVAKVFASYQNQDDNNGNSASEISNKSWQVGVQVPVFGNGKIIAQYAKLNWEHSNNASNGSSSGYALGYTHSLSKRTTLYTTYTSIKNDNDARVAMGLVGSSVASTSVAGTAALGERNGTLTAGISHAF